MSSKKTPKFIVKVNQIVNGIIHAIEHEFEEIEHVFAHLKQNEGHAYKVYNKKGELEHSGNRKDSKHKGHHHHHKDDDDAHDTYA